MLSLCARQESDGSHLPLGFDQSRSIPHPEKTHSYFNKFNPELSFEANDEAWAAAHYGIRGMDIYVTPETRDGGRDVIARGEFIPGEPTVLAVEVKQKPVVGIEDLHRSLKANEDYPALLLATSGRFSAGVITEKKRKRNELRLFLKDGVALSQWIAMYGVKRNR